MTLSILSKKLKDITTNSNKEEGKRKRKEKKEMKRSDR